MEWILCDDRLPEEGQMVLTTIRGHDVIIPQDGETIEQARERIWDEVCYVSVGFIGSDGWYGADGFPQIVHPIAWMPLPKPYTADTPQTEETEAERLDRINNELDDAYAKIRELTADTPQTDRPCDKCEWHKEYGRCIFEYCHYEYEQAHKDTPQTDCPWK